MVDTALFQAQSVVDDHHHRHDRHSGDVGDGDDAVPLFDPVQTEVPFGDTTVTPDDDPVAVIEAALIRLKDDVGVLAEDNVVRAFSILKATDMPGDLRLRHAAKVANRDCSITVLDKLVRDELPGGGDDPSALDELVDLARSQCRLKHDADRNAAAIIPMPGRQEVWRVYSTGFEEWLRAAYWRAKESGVADTTMKAALATLAAAGINDGEEVEVHIRAAQEGDCYYLDLCDEHWRVVYVTRRRKW